MTSQSILVPTTSTPLPPESQTAGQPVKIARFLDALGEPQRYSLRDDFDDLMSPIIRDATPAEYNQLLDDLVNIVRKAEAL